jgi:hypothetical protein
MTEIPVACTLSAPELRERERTVLAALRRHVVTVSAQADGYALELAPTDEAIAAAATVIQVERQCCPFLRFALTAAPGPGPVHLVLTGGPGVREFLAPWLEPSAGRDEGTR